MVGIWQLFHPPIQLDLSRLRRQHHLNWIPGKVRDLDLDNRTIMVEDQPVVEYDYLAIATGASLAFDQIPGLGPSGYTQSVCTPDHALEARQAWLEFLKNPGPMVVGAAPGAVRLRALFGLKMLKAETSSYTEVTVSS